MLRNWNPGINNNKYKNILVKRILIENYLKVNSNTRRGVQLLILLILIQYNIISNITNNISNQCKILTVSDPAAVTSSWRALTDKA